jgi:polar amino acid transport system substrate-binding protein
LTQRLRHAELVRARGFEGAAQLFAAERLDALAGLRPRLLKDAEAIPGALLCSDRFAVLPWVIGVPAGRESAAGYVARFVQEAKASGLITALLERYELRGVVIPPAAEAKAEPAANPLQ